jgi:hypothetical protein
MPDYYADGEERASLTEAITQGFREASQQFRQVKKPGDFDVAVLFSDPAVALHVGLVVAGGVLHTGKRTGGVIFENLQTFGRYNSGWVSYYRWHT